LHKIKSLEAIIYAIKKIERTWTQSKFVNLKLKTLNNASFGLNEENVSDTLFVRPTSILIVLVDRVDNFKRINMKLQTSKLHKVGSK
jgi:hypothetical protein